MLTIRCVQLLPAVVLLCSAAVLQADEQDTYQERMELDPASMKWQEKAPPVPGTAEGDLALARSLLARREFSQARKAFKKWFKQYGDSEQRPEALLYAAQTEIAAVDAEPKGGDLMEAYDWLEEILEGWPQTNWSDRALTQELLIAEMILFKGRERTALYGMFWVDATEEALMMLDRIIDDWAFGKTIAEQALRMKADYHFHQGEFEEAEKAYSRLLREFPRGRFQRESLLQSGVSAQARFPGAKFDDADLLEAEVYYQEYQRLYPEDAPGRGIDQRLERINESKAEKHYEIARYYERVKRPVAAGHYYRIILERWPQTTWASEAGRHLERLGPSARPVTPMGPPEK